MLRYNKYLKDVGIKKTDYPFSEFRKNISEDSYLRIASWNLDWALALIIYSHLRAFKDNTIGFPAYMNSPEEWDKVLDEMIDGFAYYIQHHDDEEWKEADKKLKRSLSLIAEYYRDLWW